MSLAAAMDACRTVEFSSDDVILPFRVEPFALRGRLVRLGPAIDTILRRHDYPAAVAQLLAEFVAMAVGFAAALKYDGVFTLQIKGDGPIRLMVSDVTSAGAIRGYAQYDADRVSALGPGTHSVPKLFGAGYLAFTVDQGAHTERYQGIVELTGGTLADCAHNYFRQSEQFQAGVKLAAGVTTGADGASRWRAGAVMIQRLPPADAQGSSEGRGLALPPERVEAEEEGWRRALTLMASATAAELVDPDLPPWRLVDRLFLAEGVRIYRPHDLYHACRCSRERVVTVLRSIPRDEIESLKIDGEIVVTCEFCNARHVFGEADLVRLHAT